MNVRRVSAGLCAALWTLLLAACGGNASRVEPYRPTAMVVIGDESSAIVSGAGSTVPGATASNGLKYTINYIDETSGTATQGKLVCELQAIWVQYVAATVGFDFEACRSTSNTALLRADMRANYGARISTAVAGTTSVQAQVDAYRTLKGFGPSTLVTVMAGAWDIRDILSAYTATTITRTQAVAQAERAGAALGTLINGITDTGNGGRVIYTTLPNLALTPWGKAQSTDGQQLLSELTDAFNNGVGVAGGKGLLTVTNNGRWAAILTVDVMTSNMAATTNNAYQLTNVATAACVAPLPNCTNKGFSTGTLTDVQTDAINSANVNYYLWAGEMQFGPTAQAQIGAQAQLRVLNNPF